MLFFYSVDAIDDNWLHETLLEMLQAGMHEIDSDIAIAAWPDSIPVGKREVLSSRRGLRDRLDAFWLAYQGLNPAGRTAVHDAMVSQNSFPNLFNGAFACSRLEELPEGVRPAIKNLFEFSFSLLTPLGIRDIHYKKIYQSLPARVCPFCGVENLEAPDLPREDLDHYLPISSYPFAGSNLRNLSPMGARCNSSFKRIADVTVNEVTGEKRRCSDPYSGPSFEISLNGSRPFQGDTIDFLPCPAWEIEFEGGDAEAAATWDSVFRIRDRYKMSRYAQKLVTLGQAAA